MDNGGQERDERIVPSMLRRRHDFDYCGRAIYLITIATEGRRPLLGTVVGDCEALPGTSSYPKTLLSPLGEAVRDNWYAITRFHRQVDVIALQVMPDHIHGILFVRERMEKPLGKVILGFKQGCNKSYRALMAEGQAAVVQQRTKPTHPSHADKGLLFENGYNDRILQREHQLEAWKRYLEQNPYRFMLRRAKVDYFRVVLATIGDQVFTAQGNHSLLDAHVIKAVKCSRSMSDDHLNATISQALADASQGTVHVSPFISPGERKVKSALVDAGYPIIQLVENGLTSFSKPAGKLFDYCAQGHLLTLSPWDYHTNRTVIRREQCMMLNEMAALIAHSSSGEVP